MAKRYVTIPIPAHLVGQLKRHRRKQHEERLQAGRQLSLLGLQGHDLTRNCEADLWWILGG